jgi:hypothetical protein
MSDKLSEIKESFLNELSKEGDLWRIFRRKTFVDLIKLNFVKYQKDNNDAHLIDIINLCFKLKILDKLKDALIGKSFAETVDRINTQNDLIIKTYNELFEQVAYNEEQINQTQPYDLSNEMQYLKVLNELDSTDYSNGVFDKVIYSALKALVY